MVKRKKKKYSIFNSTLSLPIVIVGILLFLGITYYKYHDSNSYDSSLDGSEIAEEQQQTIPADVQRKIDQAKLAVNYSSSVQVLGEQTQKTPFPVPASVHVPILMYHYVEYVQDKNDKKRIALNTTPYILEDEVKTLSAARYTFMTNQELVSVLDGNAQLPPKPIVLTFDDGYRDFYTDAYPILKKYHAKATEYVISGFLDRNNHLLTSQLLEIAKDGLVEIGAHTVNHVWLKGEQAKDVVNEVSLSKSALEKIIRKYVVSFAYPFGAFDEQALEAVRNAGFQSATSTIPGTVQKQENKYFFYRLRPGGRTGQVLLAWLESQK